MLWLCAIAASSGCLEATPIECADGFVCGDGEACAPLGGGCADADAVAACVGQPDLTPCLADGVCADQICVAAGCGNGLVEGDEACDDGNQLAGDGCSRGCDSIEACGNGVVDEPAEDCDDQNTDNDDNCHTDCRFPRCGDGVIDSRLGEACDAGAANSAAPDAACRETCAPPACGDGTTDPGLGEVCDDGDQVSGDGCRSDCRSTGTCGNGILDGSEACDDGNLRQRDGCSPLCTDEGMTWHAHTQGTPPARAGMGMAYDVARGRVVMFGGRYLVSGEWVYVDDTWEFDGTTWIEMTPLRSPPPRYSHRLAYDAARGRTIMFGGQSDANSTWADTWSWDGATWTELAPETSPPGRLGHTMVYDGGRDRIVLFAGWTIESDDGVEIDNDTWEWDGTTWQDVSPADSPTARVGHAMAYDPIGGRTVVLGGYNTVDNALAGTFAWDGSAWTEVTSAIAPGASQCQSLAFDGARLLYTGCDTAPWVLDQDGWHLLPDAARLPSSLAGPALAYDGRRQRLVLLGGEPVVDAPVDGTMEWYGDRWHVVTPAPAPTARTEATMAYDAARAKIVLFGGRDAGGLRADTWEWDGAAWHPRLLPDPPPPRERAVMAYDARAARVVLFGGGAAVNLDDTWEYDGTAWVERFPLTTPAGRVGAMMTYDAGRERLVMFGGFAGTRRDETWEYDWSANDAEVTWRLVTPATKPPPLTAGALVYDPVRAAVVLHGGDLGSGNGYSDQTYLYDGATWTHPNDVDPHRVGYMTSGYDPLRERVILVGGDDFSILSSEVWNLRELPWRPLAYPVIDPVLPPGRVYAAGAYDQARRQFVVFGGNAGPRAAPGVRLGDTWTLGYDVLTAEEVVPEEACAGGLDYDADAAIGCDDDDCWATCSPLCPPWRDAATCPASPTCGDGSCGELEDARSCPGDCPFDVAACGDAFCDVGEDAASCPGDCGP